MYPSTYTETGNWSEISNVSPKNLLENKIFFQTLEV